MQTEVYRVPGVSSPAGEKRSPARGRNLTFGRTSMSDVPGNVDDHHAALTLEQQQRGHQFALMVMQKVMVPTALHQLRQDHGNGPLRMMSLQIQNEINNWPENKAVR